MLPREMKAGRYKDKPLATGKVASFIQRNYHHFNSAVVKDSIEAYIKLLNSEGKMFLSLAGAMSTAQLGISLAEMIRQDKIHGISTTGANLEEDVFNLVAHDSYVTISNYRNITPEDEKELANKKINRVTDVGIPESVAMSPIEDAIISSWEQARDNDDRMFPHEFLYQILLNGDLKDNYQIDPKDSWVLAAAEKDLPIYTPGWEDSTLGNVFAALCVKGDFEPYLIKSGIEYMMDLALWYDETSKQHDMGFFQIGGGIAGDFSICVVPLLQQDMKKKDTKLWSYFCQISDAVESYGGYSGASAREKITWGKLSVNTPSFMIQSDASIVAPLIFDSVLGL